MFVNVLSLVSRHSAQRVYHQAYYEKTQRTFRLVIDGYRYFRKETSKDRVYWNCILSRNPTYK